MREQIHPASEFPTPGAEFTPPAEEYPPVPAPESVSSGSGRKKRLLKLAAGLVILAVMIVPGERAFSGGVPVPTAIAEPTRAPKWEPSAAPTAESAATPAATPAPTPTPAPVCGCSSTKRTRFPPLALC